MKPASRLDLLNDLNRPAPQPFQLSLRGAVAAVSFAAGLCVAGWSLYMLHTALVHPNRIELLQRLWKTEPSDLVMYAGKDTVQFPMAVVTVFTFFVLYLLFTIAAKLAVSFVREAGLLIRTAERTPRIEIVKSVKASELTAALHSRDQLPSL